MFSINVKNKEYKICFGYGVLCETDVLERIGNMGKNTKKINEMLKILPDVLLIGLQKKHSDEFGYETESEKSCAIKKVYDLLDDYEEENTEENPKNGMELFQRMAEELEKNGFLSGINNLVAQTEAEKQNATKIPQDHKKKTQPSGK